jgi:hypothetical protein
VYTITVTWLTGSQAQAVYSPVKEYEFRDGLLTLALDANHDIALPLAQVKLVDIVRQE